jgi:hypothetical protein
MAYGIPTFYVHIVYSFLQSQEVLRPPQERRPSLTMLLFAPRSPRLRDTDGLSEQQQHASALLDVLPRSDPVLFPGAGDYGAK